MSVPKDKHNEVYILYILHGIAVIMPWHIMMEVFSYFSFIGSGSDYFDNYFRPEAFMSKIVFMVINLFVPKSCGTLSSRMLFSIAMNGLVMAFVVLLMFSDTEKMSDVLSWMAFVSNLVLEMVCGIYLSSAFGSAAKLPMKYTTALCIGMNLEFIFVIVCNILFNVEESAPKEDRKFAAKLVAFILFFTTIIITIFSIVLEITSKSNKFREYYRTSTEFTTTRAEEWDISGNRYYYVFTQISEQLLDTFLAYFVSFTIFPNIMKAIKSSNDWITDKHTFSGVSLLITETFNLIGVIIAQFFHCISTESMISFTSARLLLIPISLLFNYQPKGINRALRVLFSSDLLYWTFNAIVGTTGGYLWTLSMMYATKEVRPQYAHIAGMMSSLIFYISISFGFNFGALVLPNFI